MPTTNTPKDPTGFQPVGLVDASRRDRRPLLRLVPTLADFEARADRELAAYFAEPRVSNAANAAHAGVEESLASILAYHRGVLGLYYRARVWPAAVQKALGKDTSIAIRLDCADHPAQGSTPALEKIAAERIGAILAAEGPVSLTVCMLGARAHDFYVRALRAYAKVLAAREWARDR